MIRIMIVNPIRKIKEIDLEEVHFCKDSKAKYRVHLTVGMMVATGACYIGTAYNMPWLIHLATTANAMTAIIWIWE